MGQKIALLKLVSGEELVARIEQEPNLDLDIEHFTIKDPRVIGLQPSDDGNVSFGLGPWVPWVMQQLATEIRIHKDKLLIDPVEPLPQDIENGYIQQTTNIDLGT